MNTCIIGESIMKQLIRRELAGTVCVEQFYETQRDTRMVIGQS